MLRLIFRKKWNKVKIQQSQEFFNLYIKKYSKFIFPYKVTFCLYSLRNMILITSDFYCQVARVMAVLY